MSKKISYIVVGILLILVGCTKKIEHRPVSVSGGCYLNLNLPELKYSLGSDIGYYDTVVDLDHYTTIKDCDEGSYLTLYKNRSIKGVGDSSKFWRWSFVVTHKEMDEALNTTLYNLKSSNKNSVYILKNGVWSLDPISSNPIGTVEKIIPLKRGPSGVVMDLYIKGSKGSYVVVKQDNIRKLFNFTLLGRDVPLLGRDMSVVFKNTTALPSGFFALERGSKEYHIYGGGYGHGVGMPQVSASELVKEKGLTYSEILHRYYSDTKISNARDVAGYTGDIKVGITKSSGLFHDILNISSSTLSTIELSSEMGKVIVESNKKIEFVKVREEIVAKVDGVSKLSSVNEILLTSKDKIRVDSIKRSLKGGVSPSYSGTLTVKLFEGKMMLVNSVKVEEYLKGVVASEMSPSYGIEPLKAQSVAARTFALGAILRKKYPKYGIDVYDTVSDQVYNNLDESEIVNRAIKESENEVLLYDGKPINAFFYSSSSGVSAVPREVW